MSGENRLIKQKGDKYLYVQDNLDRFDLYENELHRYRKLYEKLLLEENEGINPEDLPFWYDFNKEGDEDYV